MLRRSTILTPVVLFILAMAGCDACDETPTGPSFLNVSPTGPITMEVGQSSSITATARVNGEPAFATYQSGNTPVATVDRLSGVVLCVTQGTATITVTGGGTSKTVDVVCTAAVLIDVTPTTVPFNHTVGTTACPQKIGTLRITNRTGGSVNVTLSPSNPALVLDATTATVAPGASVDIGVSFNCSVQSAFSATISVTASNGVATDTKTVTVQANIAR